MTAREFAQNCDQYTFDVVLGSDGDGTYGPNANYGTHWDCWLPVSGAPSSNNACRDPKKLGKHLGNASWKQHIQWSNNSPSMSISADDEVVTCFD
jgi:hypothetical protein